MTVWRAVFALRRFDEGTFRSKRVCDRRHLGMGYRAIRTKRWKYIRYKELDGMDELYDLKKDPCEMDNVIGRRDSAAVLQRLKKELTDLLNDH